MTDQTTKDAAIDALAEAAVHAFWSDAAVPEGERSDDDAAWLLHGTYEDASERVDAHENNTGHDCARWRTAVMNYFLIRDGAPRGMAAADYAAAIAELGQLDDSEDVRTECMAVAEREVEFWCAAAARPDGTGEDNDKALAWDLAISDMEDAA